MLGLGSWGPLVLTYVMQFWLSVAVLWFFIRWLRMSDLDPPMRIMVVGICMLNTSVAIQNLWFGTVRVMHWIIAPETTVMILLPFKIIVLIATYLHLHAFLVYRGRIYGDANRWRVWCIGGPLFFFILSLMLM